MGLYFLDLGCKTPYNSLAAEEHIFNNVKESDTVLLTYIHKSSVIIGRNQNAWKECNGAELNARGGLLARRISGGGSVYHDLGNLNFSFVCGKPSYNLQRQLHVVVSAAASLGADASFSGRNDMLCRGRKFSGSAYCHRKNASLHHGTTLINTDISAMESCLNVSPAKIQSKGISSVRSRVINLSEVSAKITVDAFKNALYNAFEKEYGAASPYLLTKEDNISIARLAERNANRGFIYGESPKCGIAYETRFSWGCLELAFEVENGAVKEACAYSDAMEERFVSRLSDALKGCEFSREKLVGAVHGCANTEAEYIMANDIANFIRDRGV